MILPVSSQLTPSFAVCSTYGGSLRRPSFSLVIGLQVFLQLFSSFHPIHFFFFWSYSLLASYVALRSSGPVRVSFLVFFHCYNFQSFVNISVSILMDPETVACA
jgi:hypothetical protein